METILIAVAKDLYPGLIGAFITFLFVKTRTKIKNYKLQKKYAITGEYLSEFGDLVNGKKVTITAPASLKQEGLKVTGITSSKDRTWRLEGLISESGYLHGVYEAESFSDDGIGNFFLHIRSNGRLVGTWTGYDSVNKTIQSGSYEFTKKSTVEIHPLSIADCIAAIDLIDNLLGKDYVIPAELLNLLNDSNTICLKAVKDNRLIGVVLGYIMSRENALKITKLNSLKFPNAFSACDKVGIIKTIAVQEEYQGQGVGSRLLTKSEELLKSSGISLVMSVVWRIRTENGDFIENAGGLMRQNNFRSIGIQEEFWKQDSIEKGFSCPSCGNPPCLCAANIYYKVV